MSTKRYAEIDTALARAQHRIVSCADPYAEHWRSLQQSSTARQENAAFLVEGLRAVELMVAAKVYPTRELIVAGEEIRQRQRGTRERIVALINEAQAAGVAIFDVSREVFRHLAGVNKVRGVAAVAANPGWQVETLVSQVADQGALALATVGVVDPGNLGTLMRSAVAFGASALLALEGSAEPTHPKVLRASAGHLLPSARGRWPGFRDRCRELGVEVVAVDPGEAEKGAAINLSALTVDPSQATVVCVGAEGRGFPEGARDFDRQVRIPMQPGADSLNAAVAGSLLLWTLRR